MAKSPAIMVFSPWEQGIRTASDLPDGISLLASRIAQRTSISQRDNGWLNLLRQNWFMLQQELDDLHKNFPNISPTDPNISLPATTVYTGFFNDSYTPNQKCPKTSGALRIEQTIREIILGVYLVTTKKYNKGGLVGFRLRGPVQTHEVPRQLLRYLNRYHVFRLSPTLQTFLRARGIKIVGDLLHILGLYGRITSREEKRRLRQFIARIPYEQTLLRVKDYHCYICIPRRNSTENTLSPRLQLARYISQLAASWERRNRVPRLAAIYNQDLTEVSYKLPNPKRRRLIRIAQRAKKEKR